MSLNLIYLFVILKKFTKNLLLKKFELSSHNLSWSISERST